MAERKVYIFSDCEGPLTLGDIAFEYVVASAKIYGLGEEVGRKFFQAVSNIDDIWGDFHKIPKDPTYSAGHTLKIILPFLKAMGAHTRWLEAFARESLQVVPDAGSVLLGLASRFDTWLISTSYEFYIKAFCKAVGFDFAKARCTTVNEFDSVSISCVETLLLLNFMDEVAEMPVIEYDSKTGEVAPKHRYFYDRITEFIWEDVYAMPVGRLIREVSPVGQKQKREAVEEICREFDIPLSQALYIGDSQTDVQCTELLRDSGLTMMVNGKGRVCESAHLMYIGGSAQAIEEVVNRFVATGREDVLRYYALGREADCGGLIAAVTPENFEELHARSVEMRKSLRGIHIGSLS